MRKILFILFVGISILTIQNKAEAFICSCAVGNSLLDSVEKCTCGSNNLYSCTYFGCYSQYFSIDSSGCTLLTLPSDTTTVYRPYISKSIPGSSSDASLNGTACGNTCTPSTTYAIKSR